MSMLKSFNVIPLILLALLAVGCAASAVAPVPYSPLDEDVQRSSESMYRFMMGELAVKKDDIPAAIENFAKANQNQPSPLPRISQRLALLQYKVGDFDAALKESHRAVTANPADYNNWLIQGGILESKQQNEEALTSYSQASVLAPIAHEPVLLKASLLYRLDRKKEARETLERFVAANPHSAPVLAMLGRFFEDNKEYALAEKNLKLSWTYSKEDPSVGFDLVRNLQTAQKDAEAKEVAEQIVMLHPKDLQGRRTYAQILYNEGNLAGAIEQLRAAVPIAADPSEVEYEIALIEVRRNHRQEAIEMLTSILGRKPDRSTVRFTLANLYASLKKFQAALRQLEKILPKNKEFNRAQVLKALLLFQLGDSEQPLKIVKTLRKKTHDDPQLSDEYLRQLEELFLTKNPDVD